MGESTLTRMAPGQTSPRWILLAALGAAAALPFAAPAAVPVALYPVQADGLTDGERSEVQGVIESALHAADRRGVLEPRSPLLLPATCKPPITVGCIAMHAKGGVVLYAKAKRRGAQILVNVLFVDGVGRKTRAAAFPVDLFIQNLRPANDAIATIEAELAAGALEDPTPPPAPVRPPGDRTKVAERAPPAAAVAAKPPPERPAVTTPEPAPAEPGPSKAAAAALAVAAAAAASPAAPAIPAEPAARTAEAAPAAPAPRAEPAPSEPAGGSTPIDLAPPKPAEPTRAARVAQRMPERKEPAEPSGGDGRLSVARWLTGGGVAMLVAGSVVALTGKRLGDTLTERYASGTLQPGDAKLYDSVDRYEMMANALFVAGGVTTAAGLGFYAFAPAGGGAGVAVAGSF